MTKHAYLSASASHRWLACPPSAKLCEDYPNETTTYAQEGTDCHELCAYLVEHALGREVEDPTPHLSYYSEEMQECAEQYSQFVLEQLENAKQYCKDPLIFIEQRLDFSRWVERGFGTGDCIIVADTQLQIIDYKHGQGVLVSAENNSQMMCYALGTLSLFESLYNIETISMTIFQPRKANVSTYTPTKSQLLDWADNTLAPTAKLAYEGKGEFKAGNHCQFCLAKSVCRKRAEYNLELAKHDFANPDILSDEEIAAILAKIDQLVSWANDVKAYALSQAMAGVVFHGYKLVEGRSTRKFADEHKVAEVAKEAGFNPYEQKLLGITALTKLMGKKKFDELLGSLVYKPTGKPTLVPNTDKRAELTTAQQDFQ